MDLLKKFPIFILYIFIGLLHLVFIYVNPEVANHTKPALAGILIIAAILHWHRENKVVSITLIAALIFSGLGDYALINRGFAYLLVGIAFFWLALLCYIICFYLLTRTKEQNRRSNQYITGIITIVSLAVMAYLMTAQCIRADGMPTACIGSKLKLPMTIYGFTLLWLFLKAFKVSDFFRKAQAKFIGLGAIMFLVSDGTFAYSTWVDRSFDVDLHFVVMLSYIIAQGLISFGLAMLSGYASEPKTI